MDTLPVQKKPALQKEPVFVEFLVLARHCDDQTPGLRIPFDFGFEAFLEKSHRNHGAALEKKRGQIHHHFFVVHARLIGADGHDNFRVAFARRDLLFERVPLERATGCSKSARNAVTLMSPAIMEWASPSSG